MQRREEILWVRGSDLCIIKGKSILFKKEKLSIYDGKSMVLQSEEKLVFSKENQLYFVKEREFKTILEDSAQILNHYDTRTFIKLNQGLLTSLIKRKCIWSMRIDGVVWCTVKKGEIEFIYHVTM